MRSSSLVWAAEDSGLLPAAARGTSYRGLLHITDILPSLMGLASAGGWDASHWRRKSDGSWLELDGVDQWAAIVGAGAVPSPRSSAVLAYNTTFGSALRSGPWKLVLDAPVASRCPGEQSRPAQLTNTLAQLTEHAPTSRRPQVATPGARHQVGPRARRRRGVVAPQTPPATASTTARTAMPRESAAAG
eukprot:COSAG01_NODE_3664_length_5814_cov_15.571829_5_plen_189_part_00